MRKLTIILCLILFCGLTACNSNEPAGVTDNVKVDLGKSIIFTEEEIQSAVDCVKLKFKDFNGCVLKSLWYDEKRASTDIASYLTNGKGSVNGVKSENVIILYSDFYAGKNAAEGFNTDFNYTNWNWILIRDNKSGAWKADDWGY
jgi:hypothetical protein